MAKITIAVYNSAYSKIVDRVGSFDSAQEAAQYRDESGLYQRPTKLEILDKYDNYTPVDMVAPLPASSLDCSVDYSHAKEDGWEQTNEGWLYTNAGNSASKA